MSLNLKKVIKLKKAQQKMAMLDGWKELNELKKRESELDEQRESLQHRYSNLGAHQESYLGAELSELAIRQAGYLSMTLDALRAESSGLVDKNSEIDRAITLANAKSQALGELGRTLHAQDNAEKVKGNLESELVEATGRSSYDGN